MSQFNELSVIYRIEELRRLNAWSYYKLAKRSNISLSSLTAMIKTPHIPTIHSLSKLCEGFNISLSIFFSYLDDKKKSDLEIIDLWHTLDAESKKLALIYMKGLAHKPVFKENEKL